MLIIGIDCATIATKTGLSFAEYAAGVLTVKDCIVGRKEPSVAQQILPWVRQAEDALLALDSPLGWPESLGKTLYQHAAGAPIAIGSNELFRRRTDDVVRRFIGKNPLEVGADRIARTAVATLKVLEELGVLCNCEISLAWTEKFVAGIHLSSVNYSSRLTTIISPVPLRPPWGGGRAEKKLPQVL